MVYKGVGSIFKRTDERYFIYVPIGVAQDSAFPFQTDKSMKVKISFDPCKKRKELIIEEVN